MAKSPKSERAALHDVLSALGRHRLLLEQDKALPSVVGIVTGEALASSWWSHPRAHEIFGVLEALAERTEVLETKLIQRKVTFVSALLWPALLGVATSNEAWQGAGLSPAARRPHAEVTRGGEREASGPAVKELEKTLARANRAASHAVRTPRSGPRELGRVGRSQLAQAVTRRRSARSAGSRDSLAGCAAPLLALAP
jgi:hypothetical protein